MLVDQKIDLPKKADLKVKVSDVFGFPSELKVSAYKEKTQWVPEIDNSYKFDPETTLAILAGFERHQAFTL